MTKRQNKLGTYLAVTAGVGCASSVANAAVTFYGVNSANDINADPAGIGFGLSSVDRVLDHLGGNNSDFAYVNGAGYFTSGANLSGAITAYNSFGAYHRGGIGFFRGASLGDNNYANISFDGDNVYEAVGQFHFDGNGGGYLIAIATTNAVPNPQDLSAVGGPALSISAGKAMIDAAPVPVPSVPEPSSVALLALGATGLIARRRKKAA